MSLHMIGFTRHSPALPGWEGLGTRLMIGSQIAINS